MNWSILLTFAIVLAVYLVGLIVFTIVKAVVHKKKFNKELQHEKEESSKDRDN